MDWSKLPQTRWFPLLVAVASGAAVLGGAWLLLGTPAAAPARTDWLLAAGGLLAAVSGILAWRLARTPQRLQTAYDRALDVMQVSEDSRSAQARFYAILEVAADAIVSVDAHQRITLFNQGAEAIFGYRAEEVLGKPLEMLMPERFREAHRHHVELFMRGPDAARKMGERQAIYGLRKEGTEFPAAASISKVEVHGEKVLTAMLRDMTETVLANEAIRTLNRELAQRAAELASTNARLTEVSTIQRTILDFAGYAIISSDPEGRIATFNPAAEQMLGYAAEEIVGRLPGAWSWHDAEEIAQRARTLSQELNTEIEPGLRVFTARADLGLRDEHEWTWIRKDGSRLPVLLTITALRDHAGKVTGYLGIATDISERKRAEQAAREQERRFRAIFDQTYQFTGLMAPDGTLLEANRTALDFIGVERDDVVGRPLWDTPWFSGLKELQAQLRETIAEAARGSFVRYETNVRGRDEAIRTIDFSLKPVRDERGEVVLIIPEGRDITEHKQAEEAVRTLNRELAQHATQLEAVNRELEAFSYSVSHDLRAPLRSIDGFSQVLLEDYAGKLDAEGRDYLERVRAGTQRMAHLIDDILNLSRLTRGVMQREAVDLSALARAAAEELRKTQPERPVEFAIQDGIRAEGDARLLRIVLDNLLGNAWKYTSKHPSAKIEFGLKARAEGKLVCFVRDDGAGFDMAYSDKLFGAFQRLHSSAEFPGSGVGLATAQRIIHRHGGDIWAEGAIEKGATFYFSLPATEQLEQILA